LIDIFGKNLRNVHEAYVPKSRSLLDGVNNLTRQHELLSRFARSIAPKDVRQSFEALLKTFDRLVKDLRRVAMTHRRQDRRDDAVPHEADFPT
jgi:hypothetical protein